MLKKILLLLVVLAVAGLAAIYFFGANALNSGVKRGVETVGPRVTQTPVTLESVALSPLSGSGTLKGLVVGNPEGFASENIFSLGQIDIEVDTGTVFSDTVIIDKIHIREPAVSYERSLRSSNIKELQKNVEAFTGPKEAGSAPAEESAPARQFVIRELVIEGGTIFVGALGVGQTLPLPRIEMANIGEDGTKANIAEVLDMVLAQVLTSIGPAIANAGELTKGAVDALKTQGLERVGQASGKAEEAANEATKAVSEGLKNLLGN